MDFIKDLVRWVFLMGVLTKVNLWKISSMEKGNWSILMGTYLLVILSKERNMDWECILIVMEIIMMDSGFMGRGKERASFSPGSFNKDLKEILLMVSEKDMGYLNLGMVMSIRVISKLINLKEAAAIDGQMEIISKENFKEDS